MKESFFIITVVLIICRPFFAVFDYAINYEKIIVELCINKNRPEITCKGVCYLKNEIAKLVEDEHSTDEISFTKKALDFFVISRVLNINNTNLNIYIRSVYNFIPPIFNPYYCNRLLDPPILFA